MTQWNHDKPKKEVPMNTYYTICKNCKDKSIYRKQLVQYAIKHGKKKAAREFKTTVKTVRKWLARWQQGKQNALKDISQKPHNSPKKIKPYWEFRIKGICLKAQNDNKRINSSLLKKDYCIPYSQKTILKYMRKYYKVPVRKSKTQKKRDMRDIKAKYKFCQKLQVDIKYLDDIPEFYCAYKLFNLPKYQITARCVKTGALFIGYTYEKSVNSTSIFIMQLLNHLKHFGVDISMIHIQTDNGTEFTCPWNSIKSTTFTKIIEVIFFCKHITIPPGEKTYQSDVESSHRLIEDEFYAYQYFDSFSDFMRKSFKYQQYFNFKRYNSYKHGRPVDILKKDCPGFDPHVLSFKPIIVDKLLKNYHHVFRSLACVSS